MKKQIAVTAALALALGMPLAACGNSDAGSPATSTSTSSSSASSADFDANKFFAGQWRGSVEITGETVYGTAGGSEQMLDITFNEDGTVEVTPLEAHADLLKATGTWEGTADDVTLKLDGGKTIKLTVAGKANLEGDAKDFDIADFETIKFDFYG